MRMYLNNIFTSSQQYNHVGNNNCSIQRRIQEIFQVFGRFLAALWHLIITYENILYASFI